MDVLLRERDRVPGLFQLLLDRLVEITMRRPVISAFHPTAHGDREQGGADILQFCGAGAITMEEKENYAVLMRVAMLSALEARHTTRNMGFRCVRRGRDRQ